MKQVTLSFHKGFFLTALAFAHIIDKHYCKPQPGPGISCFCIPVGEILSCLSTASGEPVLPIPGSSHLQRIVNAGRMVGYDKYGFATCFYCIITNGKGRILTAFPGYSRII